MSTMAPNLAKARASIQLRSCITDMMQLWTRSNVRFPTTVWPSLITAWASLSSHCHRLENEASSFAQVEPKPRRTGICAAEYDVPAASAARNLSSTHEYGRLCLGKYHHSKAVTVMGHPKHNWKWMCNTGTLPSHSHGSSLPCKSPLPHI